MTSEIEAVKTNVIGTDNVLTAAIEAGVDKVICLSTDKAAYPVNAMGISKALMEKTFIRLKLLIFLVNNWLKLSLQKVGIIN